MKRNKEERKVFDENEPIVLAPVDRIISIKCCIIEGGPVDHGEIAWLVGCAEALEYYTKLRSAPVSPKRAREALYGPDTDQPKKLTVEDIED
jgi:hypothetical protein